ncbi:MAG: 50S ribosomal protein L4 [Candidatus Omnitrophica bacterium]|nr:50S ribosomal protein L4 [Candidatus Omnitrophota bacterium]
MEAITLPVFNKEGKEIESIKLDASVFDGMVNDAVIYQAIMAYRAGKRGGLAATKTRGEVSGGGKKPWKQKGTGRARHGSIRSPLWRHGGVVFGPHPRDFSYALPKKIKTLALKSSLNAKVKENNLIVLDAFELDKPKSKEAARVFLNLKLNGKDKKDARKLLLLEKIDNKLLLALRNIDLLDINVTGNTNAMEVLSSKKVIITKDGLADLVKRLKK